MKKIIYLLFLTLFFASYKLKAKEINFEFGENPVKKLKSIHGLATCASPSPMHIRQGAFFSDLGPVPEITLPDDFCATQAITVSVWIKLNESMATAVGNYNILFKGTREGFPLVAFVLSIRRRRPEFKYIDNAGAWKGIMLNSDDFVGIGKCVPCDQLPLIPAETWTMLTAVFLKGDLSLYIDDKLFMKTMGNPPIRPNTFSVMLGAGQNGTGGACWKFPGLMANLMFADTALSQEDIIKRYKQGFTSLKKTLRHPGIKNLKPDLAHSLNLVKNYEKHLPAPLPDQQDLSVEIRKVAGIPRIIINGQTQYGMAMVPSPYVNGNSMFVACRDFASAGIKLFSFFLWTQHNRDNWWLGHGKYDFSVVDNKIKTVLEACPDGYVFPRIKLDPPEWWIKDNPEEIRPGTKYVSISSKKWTALYSKMLRDLVAHMEANWGGRVIGYQIVALLGGEWIQYNDRSIRTEKVFNEWLTKKYTNDTNLLRKAYRNSKITFNDISFNGAGIKKNEAVLDAGHVAKTRDRRKFISQLTADNILNACEIIKEVTKGKKITGTFYGYGIPEHRALQRLLESDKIDFICGPTCYAYRKPGQAGVFSSKFTASYRIHDKLYWDEADIRTHLYERVVDHRAKTPSETINILKRSFGNSLTKGNELWWFLIVGNHTFHDNTVINLIAQMREIGGASVQNPMTLRPEVAVFVSEDNIDYISDSIFSRELLERQLAKVLPHTGVPFDCYLLSDLTHPDFPDYKSYIFLNAYELNDTIRQAINQKVKRDHKSAIWVYAADYIDDGEFSIKAMENMIGMKLKVVENYNLKMDRLKMTKGALLTGVPTKLASFFAINDESAEVLGTFLKQPVYGMKKFSNWTSIYTSIPLEVDMYRNLWKELGVHIWGESGDVISAGRGFIMYHAASSGNKTINLPQAYKIEEMMGTWQSNGAVISFQNHFEFGETKLYKQSSTSRK